MKQKDLTRLLAALLKNEAKARGWRSIAGEPYWTAGPLFFTLVVAANASRHSLYCSLRVKWSCLDDHLWNILGMAENAKAPSSLRANGAFTLSGQEIFAQTHENCDWGEAGLETTLRGWPLKQPPSQPTLRTPRPPSTTILRLWSGSTSHSSPAIQVQW